jgi:hypothetical protein
MTPPSSLVIPEEFICPLTLELIHDAVLTKYGHHYDKKAIFEWLQTSDCCPLTRQPLSPSMIITDHHFNQKIQAWKESNGFDQQNDPSAPVPKEFLCSLTEKFMTDPVRTRYGDVFDREAILTWLSHYKFCPVTGNPLKARHIYSDKMLARRIKQWKESNDHYSSSEDYSSSDENEATAPKTSLLFNWRPKSGSTTTRRGRGNWLARA